MRTTGELILKEIRRNPTGVTSEIVKLEYSFGQKRCLLFTNCHLTQTHPKR